MMELKLLTALCELERSVSCSKSQARWKAGGVRKRQREEGDLPGEEIRNEDAKENACLPCHPVADRVGGEMRSSAQEPQHQPLGRQLQRDM